MTIRRPWFPIVYIRGFAATRGEIEDTVATPYMGFNLGATKIRQDHKGKIVRYVFESPLIRLMRDEGYVDCYRNGDFIPSDEPAPAKSVWIFRYYEKASNDLGDGERSTIPQIARDLRRFILRIRDQVCGEDAEAKRDFRVYLAAHSMGGLIARCYLQNLCVNGTGDEQEDAELELTERPRDDAGHIADHVHLVDKAFTYATPHNGIDLGGFNAPDFGDLDPFHVRNFNRDVMRDYLALDRANSHGDRVDSLNNAYDPNRFFCLVGTNYDDYDAFFGLSRRATGVGSDGLVMISNAVVNQAPRAFAHRSHSGHFGIVNSEEGYQNLRRFLLGDWRIDAWLYADEVTLPPAVAKMKADGREIRAAYNIDVGLRVRQGMYYLHERRVRQWSAVRREYDRWVKQQKPAYLFSSYLLESAKAPTSEDTALAFALDIALPQPTYEIKKRLWEFWIDGHFEGIPLLQETLTFHLRPRATVNLLQYGIQDKETGAGAVKTTPSNQKVREGVYRIEIPLGFNANRRRKPAPSFRGRLVLQATRQDR